MARNGFALVTLVFTFVTLGLPSGCASSPAPMETREEAPPVVVREDPPVLRIDDRAIPREYRLHLVLDPDVETFSGDIAIDLDIQRPTSVIWLNATGLELSGASLTRDGSTMEAAEILPGNEQTEGVRFATMLDPGVATLRVGFSGKYDQVSSEGIFRQKDGEEWYLFTQFEAIYARQAFPAIDDPFYKTPWTLTIDTTPGNKVFANTPVASVKTGDGREYDRYTFQTSKPLPTYLVAFGVGPFEAVSAGKVRDVPLRIIALGGKSNKAAYAAAITDDILKIEEDYLGVPYAYEKLDSLSIPQTVGFGAMENAGLITYVEPLILETPGEETPTFMRRYSEVAAHEIAHQWFGDLVTPKWWDDIWLNESFATWVEPWTMEAFRPDWNFQLEEIGSRRRALAADSLETARRIREPIVDENDIERAFDTITYQKGATLLSGYERWLGRAEFLRGVQAYLKKYSFGNATAADFLDSLEGATRPGVASSFSTFLDQSGVPVVDVSVDCSGSKPAVTLSQQRFLPVGSSGLRDRTWEIPVCLRWAGGRTCSIVKEPSETIVLPAATKCPSWVQANDGGLGYYLTNYQGELGHSLTEKGDLSVAERLALLGDSELLAEGGYVTMADVLRQASLAARTDSRYLVARAAGVLKGLDPYMVPENRRDAYARLVDSWFLPKAKKLGFIPRTGETEDDALLREAIVGFVAEHGRDDSLRKDAARLARAWLDDKAEIPTGSLDNVLAIAARTGDQKLYDRYFSTLVSEPDRQVRRALLIGLAAFTQPELVKRNLSMLTDDRFDPRELRSLVYGMESRPETGALMVDYIRENWDALTARFPASWVPALASAWTYTCSDDIVPDAEGFLRSRLEGFPAGSQALDRTIERIHLCSASRALHSPSVAEYLAAVK